MSRLHRDTILISVVTLGACAVVAWFAPSESPSSFLASAKRWNLDALGFVGIVFGVSALWFSLRRLSDYRREKSLRLRSEEAAQQSKVCYQQVLDSIPSRIVLKDRADRILLANRAAAESLETTVQQLVEGVSFAGHGNEATHASLCPTGECVPTTCDARDTVEQCVVGADGDERVLETTEIPLVLMGHEEPATLIVTADVTGPAREDQATVDSLERISKAFRLVPAAMMILSLEDGKFVDVNDSFVRMCGRAREEIIGKSALELGMWNQPDTRERMVNELREQGCVRDMEAEFKTATGEPRIGRFSVETMAIGDRLYQLTIAEDITERSKSENALRDSEARYKALVNNAPEAIVVFDVSKRRFVDGNEHAERLFGLSREQLLAAGPVEVSPPTQPDGRPSDERAHGYVDRALAGETPVFEWVHKNSKGQDIQCDVRLVRFPSSTGALLIQGCVTDITERKRVERELREAHDELEQRVAERTSALIQTNEQLQYEIAERERIDQALAESEKTLQALLDNSPAVIYVKGADAKYLLINRRFEELFHVTSSQAVGKTDHDIFPPAAAEAFIANDRKVLDAANPVEFEEIVPHDNGVHTYISLKFPLTDANGLPYAVCGISTDITDRKRAEQALQVSARKLSALAQEQRMLLDHTGDFVYRHGKDGVFDYLSPSVEQITGRTVDEYSTHYTRHLTDNPINRTVIERTDKAMQTGQEQRPYLAEIWHKDGRRIMLEVNERPFLEDGRVAGIVGVSRDVTQRVRAEAALKEAKEAAEAASRAKGVFLANMSHEIRTPLTAMLGAAELPPGSLDPARQRDIILRNGRHLLSLLNDLLDMARLETGKLEVRPSECSLVEIISDVVVAVLPQRRNNDVDFHVFYESAIPSTIRTDPTRLRQAVINLVDNACKFTPSGHVHLFVGTDRDAATPHLEIRVEDSGIGIPTEKLDSVFETFAQLKPSSEGAAEGVGLGLPLAKWIVEQLDGTLVATSEVGRGSLFTVKVPIGPLHGVEWIEPDSLGQPGDGADEVVHEPAPVRLRGHVLLAEDYADTRELIRDMLRSSGADVTAVPDGQAAVQAVSTRSFDLIILDIRMPKLDGREAARQIRAMGYRAPLIALTASTDSADSDRVIEAGFDDMWSKPISLSDLLQQVSRYLLCEDSAANGALLDDPPTEQALDLEARLAVVADGFVRTLHARGRHIKEAIDSGRSNDAYEELHKLVGSAGVLGHSQISNQAAQLLTMMKTGPLHPSAPELEAFLELLATTAGTEG